MFPSKQVGVSLAMLALVAVSRAQFWTFDSQAWGYSPAYNQERVDMGFTQWANSGYNRSTFANSNGHPFEPPASGSWASTSFDQSNPDNSVFRALALSRVGYRVNESNPFKANSWTGLEYDMTVENLSGSTLNIVLGNHFHGILAALDNGVATASETTNIDGMGTFTNTMTVDGLGHTETGQWLGGVHSTSYTDPYFGPRPAWELNSFQFYGTVTLASHQTTSRHIHHVFEFNADLVSPSAGVPGSGLALADFTNTTNLTIKAYDPITGADRSNEISVHVVPEPMSMIGLASGLALLKRRKR